MNTELLYEGQVSWTTSLLISVHTKLFTIQQSHVFKTYYFLHPRFTGKYPKVNRIWLIL